MKRKANNIEELDGVFDEPEATPTAKVAVDKDAEQDEIFIRGINGGGDWISPDGKKHKLHPFSYYHRLAFMSMGARIFKLTADEIEVLNDSGYYDGIAIDAVVFVWLCLRSGSEATKESRNPSVAFDRALKWGEANKVEVGTQQFQAACEFMGIEFGNLEKAKGNFKPTDADKKTPKATKRGKR